MKQLLLLLLGLGVTGPGFGLEPKDLMGTWYRTYGIYRPWTDENQGTLSYYEEDLMFDDTNTVFIYDGISKDIKGKSMYAIVKRDGEDFLVFYGPKQKPTDEDVQKKQGFYIRMNKDSKGMPELHLVTVKEHFKTLNSKNKNKKNKKKIEGMVYHRMPAEIITTVDFIIPAADRELY